MVLEGRDAGPRTAHVVRPCLVVQQCRPVVQEAQALLRRPRAFVGEVVRDARERVDGGHVRPHRARQEQRRDGKVLVVLAREPRASGVRRLEPRVAGRDHRLVGPISARSTILWQPHAGSRRRSRRPRAPPLRAARGRDAALSTGAGGSGRVARRRVRGANDSSLSCRWAVDLVYFTEDDEPLLPSAISRLRRTPSGRAAAGQRRARLARGRTWAPQPAAAARLPRTRRRSSGIAGTSSSTHHRGA